MIQTASLYAAALLVFILATMMALDTLMHLLDRKWQRASFSALGAACLLTIVVNLIKAAQ